MSDSKGLSVECGNLEATRQLGTALGRALPAGVCLALTGTLGAGKTNLVQAIASGLGVPCNQVVSPTFTMIQTYRGRLPLVHIDTYRIADDDEFFELGIDEYLDDGEAVVAIEWANRFESLLPADRLQIDIEVLDESSRLVNFRWPAQPGLASTAGQGLRQALL